MKKLNEPADSTVVPTVSDDDLLKLGSHTGYLEYNISFDHINKYVHISITRFQVICRRLRRSLGRNKSQLLCNKGSADTTERERMSDFQHK